MAKVKTTFFCQNCGSQYAKWQGQCTSCKEWNTIVEEVIQKEDKRDWKQPESSTKRAAKPLLINEIDENRESRMPTGNLELDPIGSVFAPVASR